MNSLVNLFKAPNLTRKISYTAKKFCIAASHRIIRFVDEQSGNYVEREACVSTNCQKFLCTTHAERGEPFKSLTALIILQEPLS